MDYAQQAHRETLAIDSELLLDAMLQSTQQLIIFIDKNNKPYFFNKKAQEVFGTQDQAKENISNYVLPLEYEKETRLQLKNKEMVVHWRIHHFIQTYGNRFSILYGDIMDELEKLKQQNHILNYVLKKVPGYVFWKDLSLKIMGCNDNFAKQVGFKQCEEVIGKTDYELPWTKQQTEEFLRDDREVIQAGKAKLNIEETQRQANGEDLALLTSKVPTYDMQGKISGVLGMYVDVTKFKEAQKGLLEAKEEAELANQLKSEFILNLQHDIRTPLAGILGLARLFADKKVNKEIREVLLDISGCAKELLDYCNDIFDFSNIENGAIPIVKKSFSLPALLKEVMALESVAAKTKDLNFSLTYDECIPTIMVGDPYRIKRILINLISNSVKFTHEGYIKLSVKLVREESSRQIILEFVIEDSGIGIPEDKKSFIYEKFTRISPSNKGIYRGSGLGLRIVKQFVEEINGEIHLQSQINKGTVFKLFLPLGLPLSDTILD